MSDTACIVLTTAGTEDEAEQLADAIVQARLAACVQIQRVRSVYAWQGETRREPEHELLVVQVPARGEVRQQQVVGDKERQGLLDVGAEAGTLARLAGQDHALARVIARDALARVVQERG